MILTFPFLAIARLHVILRKDDTLFPHLVQVKNNILIRNNQLIIHLVK